MQSIPFIPHLVFCTLTPSISIKCNNQYIIIYLHLPLGFFFFLQITTYKNTTRTQNRQLRIKQEIISKGLVA